MSLKVHFTKLFIYNS